MVAWRRVVKVGRWVAVVLVGCLMGCGSSGGGGGGSLSSQTPGYNGVTAQATITQESAEAIFKTLFVQVQSPESLSSIEGLYLGSDLGLPPIVPPLLDKGGTISGDGFLVSTRSFRAVETLSYTIGGTCGGSLVLVTNIDEAADEYDVAITYNGFCYDGITMDGGYTLSVDGNGDGLFEGDIELFYTLHTVKETDGVNRYEGPLEVTWSGDAIEQSWDHVVTNLTTGLGVKYVNFIIGTETDPAEITWTQAGRFFQGLYGYVDVVTETPFVSVPGLKLPHVGRLKMVGAPAGGGVGAGWFEVFEDGFQVTVDTDGDGLVDGDSGRLPWSQMPVP